MVLDGGQFRQKSVSWIGLSAHVPRVRPSEQARRRLRSLRRYFFVAHASEDSAQVAEILEEAKGEGFMFWLDRMDLAPGPRRDADAAAAIRNALGVIVFCSHKSVRSNDVFREIAAAARLHKQIVAVFIDDVALPDGHRYYLDAGHAVRVTEPKWNAKLLHALDFLDRHRGRRALPPREPAAPATTSH